MPTFSSRSIFKFSFLFFGVAASLHSESQSLSKPRGPVILTVSGKIAIKNSHYGADFDASMLDAMPVSQITSATPWRVGVVTFSGPTLQSLLKLVKANGQLLKMSALDGYHVQIPIQDVEQFNPVLSRKINGVPLKVKDQGPLFMVFPFDDMPELKTDLYYGRSIWHLRTIVVE